MSIVPLPAPAVAVSSMASVLSGVWGDMDEARKGDHGGVTGITTGVHLIDRETSGWQPGDLDVIAARTNVGKTSGALHMARHAALAGHPVLFVPLEMTSRACALRVIAAHGCLDERALRTGQGTMEDYTTAARVIAQLGDLPLMWAEPRRLTLEELRDTIARQQQAGGCEVVFVDQLGNLKPPNSKDGRVWQVAAITGGLKEIARELSVAIVACHQINREAEHAQNKRPELWHLKDCVAATERVYDAATGALVPISAVTRTSRVASLRGRDVGEAEVGDVWATGEKRVVRLRTATGRELIASSGHRVRTVDGWAKIADTAIGTRIAVARWLPEPSRPTNLSIPEARLLGYLVADGCYVRHASVSYVKADPVTVQEVADLAYQLFGVVARPRPKRGTPAIQLALTVPRAGPGGNPIIAWLRELGVHGQHSSQKEIPWAVMGASNEVAAHFVATLWAGDGTVTGGHTKYVTTSDALALGLQTLLMRFGVVSVLSRPYRNTASTVDLRTLSICSYRELDRFRQAFRLPGRKGELLDQVAERHSNNAPLDRLPLSVTARVAAEARLHGLSWRQIGYRCQGKEMDPQTARRLATEQGWEWLALLAAPDLLWDRVVSVEPAGTMETFDLSVPGPSNFVVGGIVTHNSGSVEQDADVVLLMHREWVPGQNQQSGPIEVTVAKNRRGRRVTTSLMYHGNQTRFEDAAPTSGWAPE